MQPQALQLLATKWLPTSLPTKWLPARWCWDEGLGGMGRLRDATMQLLGCQQGAVGRQWVHPEELHQHRCQQDTMKCKALCWAQNGGHCVGVRRRCRAMAVPELGDGSGRVKHVFVLTRFLWLIWYLFTYFLMASWVGEQLCELVVHMLNP